MNQLTKVLTTGLVVCLATLFSFSQKQQAAAPVANLAQTRLEQELLRLSALSGGKVGIAALHMESKTMIVQNGKEAFPMASSYKIPIAIELLTKVDSAKLSLDYMVAFTKDDLHPGSGMISERFNWPNTTTPGVALSVRSLLELMLLISDNSATDKCLQLAGGPSAVNACMKRLGIAGLRLDRPTAWLIADWLGIKTDPNKKWSASSYDSLEKTLKPDDITKSSERFDSDPRDTSTPEAMTLLLTKLYTQPILKSESKLLLLDIMKRCETGLTRLKGALPPNTEVMHKTGTIGMTTNDVGIITLPDNAGHVAISVFVKSSKKEIPERERTIAEVARAIYDYYLFSRP
jgi:beta-lactamase class A